MRKEQIKDIAIRTFKTFIAAGFASAGTFGIDNWKAWLSAFTASGITAVLNYIIKCFENKE